MSFISDVGIVLELPRPIAGKFETFIRWDLNAAGFRLEGFRAGVFANVNARRLQMRSSVDIDGQVGWREISKLLLLFLVLIPMLLLLILIWPE